MLAYLDTVIGFSVVMLLISLLITILTQMFSSMVNHRGSNLLWGLKTLFANIDPAAFPQLTSQAEAIAKEALTHCLISDSWFNGNKVAQWIAARVPLLGRFFDRMQIASAIRSNELAAVLREIAAGKIRLAATEPPPADAAALRALAGEIGQLLAASNPNASRDVELVANAVAAGGPSAAAVASGVTVPLLRDSVTAVRTSAGKLEAWFGSMVDRVAQKFAMYMRLWTVGFACLFAFGTGLNSISLMSELYTNGAFRNALVGASQQVAAAATSVQDAQNARYTAALQQALQEANVKPAQPPQNITTTSAATQWIEANVPEAQRAEVTGRFNTDSNTADQKLIQEGAASAARLNGIASGAGFEVLKFRWPAGFPAQPLWGKLRYLFGVFITAGFLSLGAPFWFNALKSMTNLRTVVASKEASETEQS